MATRQHRRTTLFVVAACATAFAWFCAWLTGLCVDPGSWPVRYMLLGCGFALSVALAGTWLWRVGREQLSAQRHLDMLMRLSPADLGGEDLATRLSELPASNPWHDVAVRLREQLMDGCRRVQDAEHARARLEVRAQRLRAEREQIATILDGLNEPVVAIDAFDDVVLANPSAVELFDLELADDGAERALTRLTKCEELIELLTDTRRRKTPTQRTSELELSIGEGEHQCFRATARSLPAPACEPGDGSPDVPHGAVAVLRDISGHKAAQKRNAEFVSSVSHEMKTPLAGIKAYVELLADGDAEDDATRDEFLNVINGQTDRLQRLIDNLLNLARIEAGVVNVNKQTRSLNELLEEAIHVVGPSAVQKRIDLVSDLSPMYLGVLADRDMLLQATINLLSNAVKYTAEEGRVTLRSRMQDKEIVLEVEDTGVGLSPEDCEKVFEKFYRVRKDRKMAQGTGLGLPLAKHIIEDVHSGRLTVDSTPGEGSTFRATLPAAGQLD